MFKIPRLFALPLFMIALSGETAVIVPQAKLLNPIETESAYFEDEFSQFASFMRSGFPYIFHDCFQKNSMYCLRSALGSRLIFQGQELYLHGHFNHPVKVNSVFLTSLGTGDVDFLFVDNTENELQEVPLGASSIHYFSLALMLVANIARKRRA